MKWIARLFRRKPKVQPRPVTRYTHFPHNIRIFYPEIWEKLGPMPIGMGIKACYPTVCERFGPNVSIGTIMHYIDECQIEPRMPQ